MASLLIPSQGRSVFRPAGRSRRPSAAVWRAAVPAIPHETDTALTVAEVDGVTVKVVVPLTRPRVAVIEDEPIATPLARPVLLIVATDMLAEAHVTWLVRSSVVLSEYVPVAVNCSVVPVAMLGLAGVTAIEVSVAGDGQSVVPVTRPRVAVIEDGPSRHHGQARAGDRGDRHLGRGPCHLAGQVLVVLSEYVPVAVNARWSPGRCSGWPASLRSRSAWRG